MSAPFHYARLGYVVLDVLDLKRSQSFYTDVLGLRLERAAGDRTFLRCSDKPYDVILHQGQVQGLGRVGFELASSADLDRAFAHVDSLGLNPMPVDTDELYALELKAAFRFLNPVSGVQLEFYHGQAKRAAAYAPNVAKIVRLGHVVFNVADFAAEYEFWVNKLGFSVSDYVPGRIAFLRCFPNPLHHSLALVAGPASGLNHVNFMVSDIDDVGEAIYRMKKSDAPIVFGPGRHEPSGSIFLYFLDPDGLTLEYSFGMEEFPAHGARPARELEMKPETLDTWGGLPSPEWGKQGVIVPPHD